VAGRALGGSRDDVRKALAGLERDCQSPNHAYWPVDVDLRDLGDLQRSRLIGPNQIADMQLVLLAHRHRGQLATFDAGIRELVSGTRYASSLLVL
jgi:predicted nucleic acid-binding protein